MKEQYIHKVIQDLSGKMPTVAHCPNCNRETLTQRPVYNKAGNKDYYKCYCFICGKIFDINSITMT